MYCVWCLCVFFFFKQKTAYEMRISDWSSDVCSSDLQRHAGHELVGYHAEAERHDAALRPDERDRPRDGAGNARAFEDDVRRPAERRRDLLLRRIALEKEMLGTHRFGERAAAVAAQIGRAHV